ncbi:hypothetical protein C8J57DRAFT_1248938 [Mycena rebaudengoi]|nr:hypothetical protein C8J57DRAFT_1248938 [Mycena rebaudengoi]
MGLWLTRDQNLASLPQFLLLKSLDLYYLGQNSPDSSNLTQKPGTKTTPPESQHTLFEESALSRLLLFRESSRGHQFLRMAELAALSARLPNATLAWTNNPAFFAGTGWIELDDLDQLGLRSPAQSNLAGVPSCARRSSRKRTASSAHDDAPANRTRNTDVFDAAGPSIPRKQSQKRKPKPWSVRHTDDRIYTGFEFLAKFPAEYRELYKDTEPA